MDPPSDEVQDCEDQVDDPRAPRFRWWKALVWVAIVIIGGVVGIAGMRWVFLSYMDWGLQPHTYESVDRAQRMAERRGVVLIDGDDVVYGRVTSAFPDSDGYLVIETPSATRSSRLLSRSGFDPPTPMAPSDIRRLSARSEHGPTPSPTLMSAQRVVNGDYLDAVWDPVRDPRRIYLSIIET